MIVDGIPYRSIWVDSDDNSIISFIDQRFLPHYFLIENVTTPTAMATAIRDMHLRGAPLIGVAAAYGVYLAARKAKSSKNPIEKIEAAIEQLRNTRPTAVNLQWALDRQKRILKRTRTEDLSAALLENANKMAEDDIAICKSIGEHGLKIIREIAAKKKGEPVNILTHCNAGWLATVDWGTATSPIYQAHDAKIKVHVWVDETRPRNQGASLTAWELLNQGVPHTVIADNTAGLLMQQGKIDLVIVGTDRTSVTGDVVNKIGTYLKALAAHEHKIPFYVAAPSSSIDWKMRNAFVDTKIEERSEHEVKYVAGMGKRGLTTVLITPQESKALNYGFDITPSKFVTGIITERGICQASEEGLLSLFPERKK